ncbi:MAG: NAD(P)/FAD-dependent oxidoreductase [Flavobacteriaceae bacterium]
MIQEYQLQVKPKTAETPELLKAFVAKQYHLDLKSILHIEILKRSIDARQKNIKFNLRIAVYLNEEFTEPSFDLPDYPDVSSGEEVIVVGAGPAGLFAALKLIEQGQKPIVLERGKDVRARRRDLAAINKEHLVNPESNYCFGEGGAGTYSDGKLYTRSKKRGDVNKILDLFVGFGADPKIRVDAHPHIGTNKLPKIIAAMREVIRSCGGEVRFDSKVVDLEIQSSQIRGVHLADGERINASKLILATGHSARDIYELLHRKHILIEAKPFALGVRVEHPQVLIDQLQYKCKTDRGPYLPPAPYSLVKQVSGRGVYSFCMCPGGIIAPCATAPGEVVTNGWSPSKRDQATSNSGIVVALELKDFKAFEGFGPLAGMEFQKSIEQKAWAMAGETQKVPAQRLADFIAGKQSSDIPKTSYQPGTSSIELGSLFPKFIHEALQGGFKGFDRSMRGFVTNEAVVHATESRTSSPVRIPRDYKTLEHPQIKGLYPCGEGAGYAGGIISAAIDGEKCAEQCL